MVQGIVLFHLLMVIRGLAETNFTYLDSSDVSDLKKLDESYKSGTLCEINQLLYTSFHINCNTTKL